MHIWMHVLAYARLCVDMEFTRIYVCMHVRTLCVCVHA
jgi:hypothetical protein